MVLKALTNRFLSLGAGLVVIASVGFVALQSSTAAASVSTKPYVIADIGSTNAGAAGFEEWRKGVLAYLDAVDAKGGVSGHKVSMVFDNDPDFVTTTEVSEFNQLEASVHPLAVIGLTLSSSIPVIAAMGEKAHVPVILGSGSMRAIVVPTKKYEYSGTQDFQQMTIAMAKDAARAGLKKIAIVYFDSPEGIQAGKYAQAHQAQLGVQIVTQQFTPLTATDFTSEVGAALSAGAQGIISIESPAGTLLIADALKAQDSTIPLYSVEADTGVAASLSSTGASFRAISAADLTPNTAGWKAMSAAASKYGFAAVLQLAPGQFANGWELGAVLTAAMKICGSNCTAASFNVALQKTHGVSTGGLSPPLGFTTTNHNLISVAYPSVVKNGHFVSSQPINMGPN